MPGYKVRLGDGSEIGPLDLEMVRSWYSQGLINEGSPVLPPGSRRWGKLADILPPDIRPRKAGGTGKRAAAPEPEEEDDDYLYDDAFWRETPLWRSVTASVFFFLAAVGAGILYFVPYRWRIELQPAPWREIALGCLLIALFLVRGSEWGRRISRVTMGVLGFAVFPLVAVLFVRGVRNDAYLVLLGLWFVASGFFFFLAWGRPPLRSTILSLLAVVVGAAGIVYFGVRPDDQFAAQVREWTAAGRRFEDVAAGMAIDLPGTWVMLREGNPLVASPAQAKVQLADPSQRAYAFLQSEESPAGVVSLDAYVDRLQAARRLGVPTLREVTRSTVPVRGKQGRRTVSLRDAEGGPVREVATTWKDGWTYVTLVAWAPAADDAKDVDVEGLIESYTVKPENEDQLRAAVTAVTVEVPHLSAAAAEALMGQSAAHVLEPDDTFRRAHTYAARGLRTMPPGEVKEMSQVLNGAYTTLPAKERTRLAAYLERAAQQLPTSPAEDKEMKELLKGAVLKLSPDRRERLQALYEKAVFAGILQGPA